MKQTAATAKEAADMGAALAHDNANWDEGTRLAHLFFSGRTPLNPNFGWGGHDVTAQPFAYRAEVTRAIAAWTEYQAAYAAFFDGYYRRAAA